MESIVYNKIKEIIRRTPIRIEESIDTEFINKIRIAMEEQIRSELLREQLIDAGIITEYESCDDEFNEIYENYIEISDDEDDFIIY